MVLVARDSLYTSCMRQDVATVRITRSALTAQHLVLQPVLFEGNVVDVAVIFLYLRGP